VKEKIKHRLYLIATIVLLLLSVDFISIYLFSDKNIEVSCDCPDYSKHCGHSHNHIFEDEVLHGESHSNKYRREVFKDFLFTRSFFLTDSYCSNIWQPPKIS
jgi:hypothetical protein